MADDETEETEPTTPAKGDPANEPAADGLGAAGKKALDTERQARRDAEKKAKDLEGRLNAIEDKDKSEVEKLTATVQQLTNERDQAVTRADRIEVSVIKSLDEDKAKRITSAAKRLTGTTREELEADADEFLTAFAAPSEEPRPTPSGKPREQLKPGSGDPDTPVEETDVKKLGERMFSN